MTDNVPPNADAEGLATRWLKLAKDDLAVAKALVGDPDDAYLSAVCFHAQQAVEKALKSILILREREFPKTHDLEKLADLLVEAGLTNLGLTREHLAILTEYAVDVRYAADISPPTPDAAKEATQNAEIVLNTVQTFLLPRPSATERLGSD